ncbi:hypothetical protein GCM10010103_73140 [Streptomyces paradoxus]
MDDRSRARGVGARLARTADGRAVPRPPTAAAAQAVHAPDDADHRTMAAGSSRRTTTGAGRYARTRSLILMRSAARPPVPAPSRGCALRLRGAVSRVAVQPRPQPGVQSGAANVAIGPVAGLVDRAKEAVRKGMGKDRSPVVGITFPGGGRCDPGRAGRPRDRRR